MEELRVAVIPTGAGANATAKWRTLLLSFRKHDAHVGTDAFVRPPARRYRAAARQWQKNGERPVCPRFIRPQVSPGSSLASISSCGTLIRSRIVRSKFSNSELFFVIVFNHRSWLSGFTQTIHATKSLAITGHQLCSCFQLLDGLWFECGHQHPRKCTDRVK